MTGKTRPEVARKTGSHVFRRVPKNLWPALGESPGAVCDEAIRKLLDLRGRQKIEYRAIGSGGEKRSVRLDDKLYDRMREAAREDSVNINEFFIHALRVHLDDL